MFKLHKFLFALIALFSLNANAQGIFAGGSGKGDASKTGSNISISSQPSTSTQTVAINALPTNVSITATSNSAITYQWYSNTMQSTTGGSNLGSSNGANTNAYTPLTTGVGTTYYYCMLSANGFTTKSNVSGAVIVNCANISVQPSVTAQYLGLNATASSLSVTASSGSAFTYQWYQNMIPSNTGGTLISLNGNANTYAPLTNVVGSLYYYCVVTVAACSPALASNVSGALNVTYLQAFNGGSGKGDASKTGSNITISSQPSTSTQTVAKNAVPTNISITATSNSTVTYQWYSSTTQSNTGGTSLGSSNGATTNTYTPVTTSTGTTYYYCLLSANGFTTKSSVSGAVIVNCANIAVQPSTTAQYLGLNTTASNVSATASAGQAFTYQWYQNILPSNTGGTMISSAGTSNTYAPLTNAVSSLYYYCVISVTGCSPAYASNVSGAVNVTYLQAFNGGSGKGDARAIGTDVGGTFWLTTGTSNYATPSNWSTGSKPTTKPAFIPAGGTQPIISSSEIIPNGGSVKVLSGATLTIASTGTLAVNGSLVNEGNVIVASNATGTGSIGASTGTITGNITVQRFIPGSSGRKYRYLAAPFSSGPSIASSWQQQIHITGSGTGGTACPSLTPHTNGFDASTYNNPSMLLFNQATAVATVSTPNVSGATVYTNAWNGIANTNSSNLVAGVGYSVFVRGARGQGCGLLDGTNPTPNNVTLSATGTVNSGPFTFNIGYHPSNGQGWNLVGNPYPSSINWNSNAWSKTNVDGTIWTFNPSTNNYATYNGTTGVNGGSNIIGSGMAFFVKANAASPLLTVTESAKTNSQPPTLLLKGNKPFEIRITLKDTFNRSDETVIALNQNKTDLFDHDFDAEKMGNPSNVNIYSIDAQSIKYAINAIAIIEDNGEKIVPLGIGQAAPGAYQIKMYATTLPSFYKIFLRDHYLHAEKQLLNGEDFVQSINVTNDSASYGNLRFDLAILNNRPHSTGFTDLSERLDINVFPNPTNGELQVNINESVRKVECLKLFNSIGQLLYTRERPEKTEVINLGNFGQGIYLLQVIGENDSIKTFKVIMN